MIDKKVCLLVNQSAGSKYCLSILKKVEATLHELQIDFHTVLTNTAQEAQTFAKEAAQKDEFAFVYGGDGSLRVVAEMFKHTQGVVSIIPCGRGNDFARMLNIPIDPIAACRALANGVVKEIDMAEVNGKPYLGICCSGMDALANEIANQTRLIRGNAVYLYAGLIALIRWKPTVFQVEIDGKHIEHLGYAVAVANSKFYGGGMRIAPDASITDGSLDVILIGNMSKWRMIVNMTRVFKGTHIYEPKFKIICARHVKINTDLNLSLYADGDPISKLPADIQVLPKALRVLVPRDADIQ